MATATPSGCAGPGIAESGFLHSMLFGGLLFGEDIDEERGLRPVFRRAGLRCVVSCKSKARMKQKTRIGL
ncbi:galacturonosyltransferase 8-like [Pyrus ussuriensis x Pyrus communis]|uniref:Galacturonosyltransferase 8-like n=1 Tax=Pyrus ussuriensis x Pyrus communis TaxID=2448454 RepID=A0A5N5HAP0_9ROSA|nr:galacturonosyltransferase 8-like [Pyrus ussuriensis x Pyrus communis]KAB2627418.1 galacturonosyltransferase 8-like [Pyrus ussuriensis x Pyrus communis]